MNAALPGLVTSMYAMISAMLKKSLMSTVLLMLATKPWLLFFFNPFNAMFSVTAVTTKKKPRESQVKSWNVLKNGEK